VGVRRAALRLRHGARGDAGRVTPTRPMKAVHPFIASRHRARGDAGRVGRRLMVPIAHSTQSLSWPETMGMGTLGDDQFAGDYG
jgi:hypothetical protein